MKKLFVIIIFLNLIQMNAQDSLSNVFTKILNEYRIQNNLHPLIYDSNLDSVSMKRLIETAHGIDDCFENPEKGPVCKDGIRNQHFKFAKTMDSFNRSNQNMQILSENMLVIAEFTTIGKMPNGNNTVTASNVDSLIISRRDYTPCNNVAEFSLKSWIDSHNHNLNLLHREATKFSFRIYRMKHFNLDWIHAVFLLVNEKK